MRPLSRLVASVLLVMLAVILPVLSTTAYGQNPQDFELSKQKKPTDPTTISEPVGKNKVKTSPRISNITVNEVPCFTDWTSANGECGKKYKECLDETSDSQECNGDLDKCVDSARTTFSGCMARFYGAEHSGNFPHQR